MATYFFGPGAELAQFGNTGTSVSIKQAYFKWNADEKLQFTVGQFGTHIGYEVVDAPDNFNYSLSYLFGNGPFYHVGLKADYTFNDKWSGMLGLLNGWDHIIDNNHAKTLAAQLRFEPNDNAILYLNYIGGNEDPTSFTGDTLADFKQMIDLTASTAVGERFTVGINSAFGLYHVEATPYKNWWGTALYLQYAVVNNFKIGARYEYFNDEQAVQYLGTSYSGFTLTGSIETANGHVFIKPEFRLDNAKNAIYSKGNDWAKNQRTFGIAVVGRF
ncbi:MAG: porin [Bacteroidetes bacterium]|nr:porin [Bacteroidota bacterium]